VWYRFENDSWYFFRISQPKWFCPPRNLERFLFESRSRSRVCWLEVSSVRDSWGLSLHLPVLCVRRSRCAIRNGDEMLKSVPFCGHSSAWLAACQWTRPNSTLRNTQPTTCTKIIILYILGVWGDMRPTERDKSEPGDPKNWQTLKGTLKLAIVGWELLAACDHI